MPAEAAVLTGTLPPRPSPPPSPPTARPARIARMLAFAIQVRRAVEDGDVADYAAVARQLGVSRQKISALVRLTFLAPDLQEQILSLTTVKGEPVTERAVFEEVARHVGWKEQRAAWNARITLQGSPNTGNRARRSSTLSRRCANGNKGRPDSQRDCQTPHDSN